MSAIALPMTRPMGLQLAREELVEKTQRNLAQHRLNLAQAERTGEMEGVRIATLGIMRCNGVLSLLNRKP